MLPAIALVLLAAALAPASAATYTHSDVPSGVGTPLAYYAIDDGAGFNLKESVSNIADAGKVIYQTDHQTVTYDQPNWVTDEFFGPVISCGDKTTEQKDTLELSDVDYGVNGAFTINVWFRHHVDNFENFQREQFFGHGDPRLSTPSQDQIHYQFEKSGAIRTILYDTTDPDQYECAYCNGDNEKLENATGEPCGWNKDCWGPYKGWCDTLPAQTGSLDTGTGSSWHMLTLTTHPDGSKGYSVYIDGELRAGMPYSGQGVDVFDTDDNWQRVQTANGGNPIDPLGPMRFCGRIAGYGGMNSGFWSNETEHGDDLGFHTRRYFLGQIAHASFFSSAMTKAQVNTFMQSYQTKFNIPAAVFQAIVDPPSSPPPSSSGLSTGAIVGIAVGAVLGTALLVAASVVMFKKSKKPNVKGGAGTQMTA